MDNNIAMTDFHYGINRRLWFCVLILFIVAIAVFPANYLIKHHSRAKYVQKIPLNIGSWRGVELEVDEKTLEILGTDDVAMRRYFNESAKIPFVDLAIVFSQEDRGAVHPPEACYTGSGWDVQMKKYRTLNLKNRVIEPVELIIKRDDREQLVLYWYKSGEKYTGNYYYQQLNVVFNQLLNKKTSSVLIRLSTNLLDKNIDDGLSRLNDFAESLFPYIEEYIP